MCECVSVSVSVNVCLFVVYFLVRLHEATFFKVSSHIRIYSAARTNTQTDGLTHTHNTGGLCRSTAKFKKKKSPSTPAKVLASF